MPIKTGAHIGHGAIIHGATIGKNCLVGMNANDQDNVELQVIDTSWVH
jgi:carbonic anhydrase/acetyltransferase-like protein (isoleucine patch superfamily)